ncbi:helix-turn-helix domain-containing protein [Frondihabitans sp. 4ASC-45]|uniref:helix-turn-helix transcriptional regulator n=1 Tax=Frondihabitans sp. 4ASC-45 TaxID=3111636 RepID=UPI003C1F2B36
MNTTTLRIGSQYLDVGAIAEQLGVSVATIYRWRSEKRDMPRAFKAGGKVRWTQDSVDEWVQSQMLKEAV